MYDGMLSDIVLERKGKLNRIMKKEKLGCDGVTKNVSSDAIGNSKSGMASDLFKVGVRKSVALFSFTYDQMHENELGGNRYLSQEQFLEES